MKTDKNRRKTTLRRVIRCAMLASGVSGLLIIGAYVFFLHQFNLEVVRYDFPVPPGYENLIGMKIVQLTDLHMLDTQEDLAHLRRIIKIINDEKPDLIVFTGDLIATDNLEWALPPARIVARMRALDSKYGTFAVTGNHDWYGGEGETLIRMLERVGIRVLDNKSFTVPGRFNVVGVRDEDGVDGPLPLEAMKGISADLPTIVLMHRPGYHEMFPDSVKLFFAGHTHGGQINLPVLRYIMMRHNHCEKYTERYSVLPEGHHLFISSGIGTSWIRVRINCPSDIQIINCVGASNEKIRE